MVHNRTDRAVAPANDDEFVPLSNRLPDDLWKPLRMADGISGIEYKSRFREQALGLRIGAGTTARPRVHHEDRATASLDLLFER